jgi:hypothetical protein
MAVERGLFGFTRPEDDSLKEWPKPRTLPPGAGLRIALGAIVKDEAAYLLEWIAYHRVLGIGRFFVADNDSTDGTSEMLEALDAAGIVRRLAFPTPPGVPPQLPAYREILRRHGAEADWIAFIDADEFLVPAPGAGDVADVVAAIHADPTVGAIAVNWAIFGSSRRVRAGEGLVIERFADRAERSFFPNHHFKSIVRPSAVSTTGGDPHTFRLSASSRTVHPDGTPLDCGPLNISGVSGAICWSPLRINHYVVKSQEEFLTHKIPRGRATAYDARDYSFFVSHDRNERRDPVAASVAAATRREQTNLARLVARALGALPSVLDEPARMPVQKVGSCQEEAEPDREDVGI